MTVTLLPPSLGYNKPGASCLLITQDLCQELKTQFIHICWQSGPLVALWKDFPLSNICFRNKSIDLWFALCARCSFYVLSHTRMQRCQRFGDATNISQTWREGTQYIPGVWKPIVSTWQNKCRPMFQKKKNTKDLDNSFENQIQPSNCLENWVTSGSTVLKDFGFRQNWWNSSFAALSPSPGPRLMLFWLHLHCVTIYRQHYCFIIHITTSRLCLHSASSTAKDMRLNAYSSLSRHFSAVKTAAWISNKFCNLK